jgi:signal transduction histidine kinase
VTSEDLARVGRIAYGAGRAGVWRAGAAARAGLVAIGRGLAIASLIPATLTLLAVLLWWLTFPASALWVALAANGFTLRELVPGWSSPAPNASPVPRPAVPEAGYHPPPAGPIVRVIAAVALVIVVSLIPLIVPPLVTLIRRAVAEERELVRRWTGIPVLDCHRPYPGRGSRLRWLAGDPATWRDLGWIVVNGTVGAVLLLVPGLLAATGALYALRVVGGLPGVPSGEGEPERLLLAVVLVVVGLGVAPPTLRGYGQLTRSILAGRGTAELNRRITHLARTRTETIDASAAEIRRIERDLHDGAQARLVAIGMALDAAGQLMESRPGVARELLSDARDNSARALAEIRGLVRGIHPPVLADRGLADAVRALALDTPLPITVSSDLTRRLPAPLESAAYFAASELLANVVKHADAGQAHVDILHDGEALTITVADDGHGGANPRAGTGLRGVQRRLAAFDGVLIIDSPLGGPTIITMELPCAPS